MASERVVTTGAPGGRPELGGDEDQTGTMNTATQAALDYKLVFERGRAEYRSSVRWTARADVGLERRSSFRLARGSAAWVGQRTSPTWP